MRIALRTLFFFFFIAFALSAKAQPIFDKSETPWADSLLATLSVEEKIGQLFMVAAYSNRDAKHEKELLELVERYKIGGLIFFQGGPVRETKMYNRLQSAAEIPLLIGMDAEWGLGMRLDSTISFPRQMTLGAIRNDSLIYAMGKEIARQSRRIGIHVNFAPVVDVNNNPNNPVINNRSFGEDKENVERKGLAYMHGMQDNGVLANAKHFPGHGDTDTDSHYNLPVIKHDMNRLRSVELYPYSKMFKEGLGSIMVAHLSIPSLDSTPNRASTLSPNVVTGLLQEEMGFDGLIFTDALNMKGVSKFYDPGEVDLLAAKAGNDVLLFAEDVPKALDKIRDAIADGSYSEADLNRSVAKILKAKEWAGIHRGEVVSESNIFEDLNTPEADFLKQKLSDAAMTLVQNKNGILPLGDLDSRTISVVTIGGDGQIFKNRLAKYTDFKSVETVTSPEPVEALRVRDFALKSNTVIINVEGTSNSPSKNFGLSGDAINLIETIAAEREVILVFMGNPYALAKLNHPERLKAILVGYQDDAHLNRAAAEAIMGAIPVTGKLPVSVGEYFKVKEGIELAEATRLHYTSPMEFGLSPEAFAKIDSIAMDGIQKRAYPGAQILIAKKGKVIFNQNYGFHTYDDQTPVRSTDLYDLASITKIVASTISLMKLDDLGKFDLDAPLSNYFPEIRADSPYYTMQPRRMLAHVAGLKAWIPFYVETMNEGEPKWDVYSKSESALYSREVARQMYINNVVSDSLMFRILASPLRPNRDYKYSDLGYYFMREIVKRQSGLRLDSFAASNFYEPMGLQTMGYQPLERFPKERIVPTEYDTYFRGQLVHGYVHDPGAAMQGGVGGHAGVFSNAEDLAAIMQMLINKGEYGGERFLSEAVVSEYTRCQFCDSELDEERRGAGFDKPVIPDGPGPTCKCVSFDSFGHSGFTGTIAWADPVEDIVYVFLSNRVYPSAENKKLARMDIRTNIQEEIYRVLSEEKIGEGEAP
ncbi:serine hydrolase [Cryomorphaceae bacterium 1068]|nr:serine hydrolase [Cryomorphaceae bacterium 1068]